MSYPVSLSLSIHVELNFKHSVILDALLKIHYFPLSCFIFFFYCSNLLITSSEQIHTTFFFFFLFFLLVFLGLHPWHMEVSRLGVESELQLPPYTTATATATPDLSRICNLHHSSRQRRILNALSKASDRTSNLVVPSWICYPLSHDGGTPIFQYFLSLNLIMD